MQQKCTLEKLMKILDRITFGMGFGHIAKIGLAKGKDYIIYYNDQRQPSKNIQL